MAGPVIPNKYLATNLNRYTSEPGSLLRGENVVNDDGVLSPRRGFEYLPEALLGSSSQANARPIKLFWYNSRPWVYFQGGGVDIIGYYQFDSDIWHWSYIPSGGGADYYDSDRQLPQLIEANRRLMFLSNQGLLVSPKLNPDANITGSANDTVQTSLKRGGCPKAVYISTLSLTDTSATYEQNWLADDAKVAYRNVWKRTDANGIDNYGAPSGRVQVYNTSGGARAVTLDVVIPQEICDIYALATPEAYGEASRFTCEVYRTRQTLTDPSGLVPDPGDEMFMVAELRPTAADLTGNHVMTFLDIQSDSTLQGPLYTNETQEGAAAGRERVPLSTCMEYFSDTAFFGNNTGPWGLSFDLLGVEDSGAPAFPSGLRDGDVIIAGDFALQASTAPLSPEKFLIDTTTGVAAQIDRILATTKNYVDAYNIRSSGGYGSGAKFYIDVISGPNDFVGSMNIAEQLVYTDRKPYVGLYRANGWPSTSDSAPIAPTPLCSPTKGKGRIVYDIDSTTYGPDYLLVTMDSAPDFVVDDLVYWANAPVPGGPPHPIVAGEYTVSIVGPSGGLAADQFLMYVPGLATGTVETAGAGAYVGYSFIAGLMCSQDNVNGLTIATTPSRDVKPNGLAFSAIGEPESAPLFNRLSIGALDAEILAVYGLGESLFVFKEDGLFRVNGFNPQWQVSEFDPNVILCGPDMVATMGGNLYCLATNGVYQINESQCVRISYDIQNQLDPIIWNSANLRKKGFMFGDESEHRVYLYVPSVGATNCDLGFTYDNSGWLSRSSMLPTAYMAGGTRNDTSDTYTTYEVKPYRNWLTRGRKEFNYSDYSDESIIALDFFTPASDREIVVDLSYTSDQPGRPAIDPTSFSASMFIGAVVEDADGNRGVCVGAADAGSSQWYMLLDFPTPEDVNDWSGPITVHLGFRKEVQWIAQDDGAPSSRKHYTDLTIFFDQPYFTEADLSLQTDIVPTITYMYDQLDGFANGSNYVSPLTWNILTNSSTITEKAIQRTIAAAYQRASTIRIGMRTYRAQEFFKLLGYEIRSNVGGRKIERSDSSAS